jgi:hypothetical protein
MNASYCLAEQKSVLQFSDWFQRDWNHVDMDFCPSPEVRR